MGNEPTDKPLEKMTVKELRELAREIPGITGVHAMKKDELIAALGSGGGGSDPAETRKSPAKKEKTAGPSIKTLSRAQLKEKISQLHAQKKAAQEGKNKNLTGIIRRRINRLKKQTRRTVQPAG